MGLLIQLGAPALPSLLLSQITHHHFPCFVKTLLFQPLSKGPSWVSLSLPWHCTLLQDCLRACQEQIESLLESSLRQAQQHSGSSETKTVEDEADLSCTPTDVRDVNI